MNDRRGKGELWACVPSPFFDLRIPSPEVDGPAALR